MTQLPLELAAAENVGGHAVFRGGLSPFDDHPLKTGPGNRILDAIWAVGPVAGPRAEYSTVHAING
jgi:hypothetical protein